MSALFSPVRIGPVEARNRAWVSPMCQYSCDELDGMPGEWHHEHLASFARGGAGLVMTEAAAVVPEGRISPQDAGIWNDAQAAAWAPIAERIRAHGAVPAMQLAHAGRKASTYRPWSGSGTVPAAEGGWQSVSAGADAFGRYAPPRALTTAEVAQLPEAFAAAARRAVAAGFDVIEVHAAHGYLLHQFLSPLSNQSAPAAMATRTCSIVIAVSMPPSTQSEALSRTMTAACGAAARTAATTWRSSSVRRPLASAPHSSAPHSSVRWFDSGERNWCSR